MRGAAAYTISLLALQLDDEFQWTESDTALLLSLYTLMFAIFMFVGGLFVDWFGPRRPLIVGSALVVASHLLASRMSSPLGIILSYGVALGIGVGTVCAAATVAVTARWYPEPAKRGPAIGFSIMGIGIGSIIVAPLWAAGNSQWGWRNNMLVAAAIYAVVLAVIASIMRFPKADEVPAHDPAEEEGGSLDLREALLTRELWTLTLILFLSAFGGLMVARKMFANYSESIDAGAVGLSIAGVAVMLQSAFNAAGRPVWGWISGRVGVRLSSGFCGFLMVAGLLMLAGIDGGSLTNMNLGGFHLFGVAVLGFGYGGAVALAAVNSATMFGTARIGRVYGLIFMIGFGGAELVGPAVGRSLHARTGDYHLSLWIAAALAGLAGIIALLAFPNRGYRRLESEW